MGILQLQVDFVHVHVDEVFVISIDRAPTCHYELVAEVDFKAVELGGQEVEPRLVLGHQAVKLVCELRKSRHICEDGPEEEEIQEDKLRSSEGCSRLSRTDWVSG